MVLCVFGAHRRHPPLAGNHPRLYRHRVPARSRGGVAVHAYAARVAFASVLNASIFVLN